jgi:hypothetical protein
MKPYVFLWQMSSLLVDISKLSLRRYMLCPLEKLYSETLAFAQDCLMTIADMDMGLPASPLLKVFRSESRDEILLRGRAVTPQVFIFRSTTSTNLSTWYQWIRRTLGSNYFHLSRFSYRICFVCHGRDIVFFICPGSSEIFVIFGTSSIRKSVRPMII